MRLRRRSSQITFLGPLVRVCADPYASCTAASAVTMDPMRFHVPGMTPQLVNPPPQVFGAYGPDGMPLAQQLPPDLAAQLYPDQVWPEDFSDAKRRRISRVRPRALSQVGRADEFHQPRRAGLRHVQEEEDQVRRQAAGLFSLRQLQDQLRLHPGREEAQPPERVSRHPTTAMLDGLVTPWLRLRLTSCAGPSISRVSRTGWAAWSTSCGYQVRPD